MNVTRTTARITAAALAAAAAAATVLALTSPGAHAAAIPLNCAASLHTCGYPDATTTGPPAGTTLKAVPAQLTSGPGWTYNASGGNVEVTGAGATLAGLSITGNVNITASHVTINNDHVTASGTAGISLRHTTGVTVENTTIAGKNTTTGRVGVAITDIYGDSTAMTIKNNNISAFKTGIQVTTGTITGNYLHNPGYLAGDHTNVIFDVGTTQPLTITGNTILNSLSQTDAISLDATKAGSTIANKTITANYIAGGSYSIYGGDSQGNATSNIHIQNNRFGQAYYRTSGQFGPVAYFAATGHGNKWTGNTWDTTGATVPAP